MVGCGLARCSEFGSGESGSGVVRFGPADLGVGWLGSVG